MDTDDINKQKVMQLATSSNGQPWICSVYFVVHDGNFYWLSLPTRRHSTEITKNKKAALAIALKRTMPVKGLQVEGEVHDVTRLKEVEMVIAAYVEKYNQGGQFVDRFRAGQNKHHLYCLVPRDIKLFDETVPGDEPYRTISFDATNLSHRAISRVGIRKRGIL